MIEHQTQEPIDPNWSDTYQRAVREGKGVLFICHFNRERSPNAAAEAVERGETNTSSLDLGMDGLEKMNDQELENRILELAQQNVLRIFNDDTHRNLRILDRIKSRVNALVQAGKLKDGDVEYVDMMSMLLEESELTRRRSNNDSK